MAVSVRYCRLPSLAAARGVSQTPLRGTATSRQEWFIRHFMPHPCYVTRQAKRFSVVSRALEFCVLSGFSLRSGCFVRLMAERPTIRGQSRSSAASGVIRCPYLKRRASISTNVKPFKRLTGVRTRSRQIISSCSVVETVQVGYRLVKQAQSRPQAFFPERKFSQPVTGFRCAQKNRPH
jgi:hypothetical protein